MSEENELLKIFKLKYRELINTNPYISYQAIKSETLKAIGVIKITNPEIEQCLSIWYEKIHLQSELQLYLDNRVEEIIFHGPKNMQILSKSKKDIELDYDLEDYQLMFETLAMKCKQSWNFTHPFVSFDHNINGINLRISLVHFSITPHGISKAFIRKAKNEQLSLHHFELPIDQFNLIKEIISNKKNILISGKTNSGKTSFVKTLIHQIDINEHLVILEDTHELKTNNKIHTHLLSDHKQKDKSLKDFCSYVLRMAPDRILLGEIRSIEVVPFLLLMNTGHKGMMSTIHANSASDAIKRVALLFSLYSESKNIDYNLVLKLVSSNIDYVIHLDDKKITEITKILGSEKDQLYFENIYKTNNELKYHGQL